MVNPSSPPAAQILTLLSLLLAACSVASAYSPRMADLSPLEALLSPNASISYQPYENEECGDTEGEEATYWESSYSYNAQFPSRPKAVVSCATTQDVAETVRFFAEHRLSFRLRASGHNLAGYSGASCSQYLLDVSRMDQLERLEGSSSGLTKFGPGLRSDQLFNFLLPYREVIVSCAPSVHASGMVLAGGISELSTVQGMSTDLAKEIELVTYDGTVVTASADENSELFFALRGAGGGNFGVVTSVTIAAIPVPSDMGAGKCTFVVDQSVDESGSGSEGIKAFVRAFREDVVLSNSSGIPVEMAAYLTIMTTGGGRSLELAWTYFGEDMQGGMAALGAWVNATAAAAGLGVAWEPPKSTSYEEYVAKYSAKVGPSHSPETWLSPFLSDFGDAYVDALFAASDEMVAEGGNAAVLLLLAEQVNGVPSGMANGGSTATSSFAFRDAKYWMLGLSICSFGKEDVCARWGKKLLAASRAEAGYLGLYYGLQARNLDGEGGDGALLQDFLARDSQPDVWQRIMDVKTQYDPQNVFCFPLSVIPCDTPSADQCATRGPAPAPAPADADADVNADAGAADADADADAADVDADADVDATDVDADVTDAGADVAGPGEACEENVGCSEGVSCKCFPVPSPEAASTVTVVKERRSLLFGEGASTEEKCYCVV